MSELDRPLPSGPQRLLTAATEWANARGVYLGKRSAPIHAALYRRTAGRVGGHPPGFPAVRIALVDHVPTHPAWFHNLMASPETTIQVGSQLREVRARVADSLEPR